MGCGIGAPGQQLKAPDLSGTATSDRQWLGWAPVFCDFSVSIVIYYNFFQTIKYLKLHCILRLICLVIDGAVELRGKPRDAREGRAAGVGARGREGAGGQHAGPDREVRVRGL